MSVFRNNQFDPVAERRTYYLTFTLLFMLQLCPIWFTPYPAMHDYPNHLARAVILHEYSDNESYQVRYEYEREWWLIPNLAIDLIVPALMNMAGVETASKLFLSLVVLMFNLGVHVLGLAVNTRPHWHALVGPVFLYNFFWPMGLVNYLFGLGMFFTTFALWLRFRSAWTWGRVLMITLLAMACYGSHFSAAVFFGISVVCATGYHLITTKTFRIEQLTGLLPLVPPTLAYLRYSSGIPQKAPMEWWQPILMKKVTGLLYPFLSYDLVIDAGIGLAFAVLGLLSLKLVGRPHIHRELFLIAGILAGVYAVSPMSGGVQSTYVDRRIIIPSAVLVLLAVRIDFSKQVGRYLLIGLLSLSIVRVAEVWYYGNRIGKEVQRQVQMLEHLPEGVRLYPMFVHDESSGESWLWDEHFFHTAHYATIYRRAFVPTLYAWRSVFPIHLRSSDTGYFQIGRDSSLEQVKWDVVFNRYDYLFGYKLSARFREFLVSNGDVVVEDGATILIRIKRE